MSEAKKDKYKPVVIRPPKPRVRTPLKTGTVVHKTQKTYTRKIKHKGGADARDEPGEADHGDDVGGASDAGEPDRTG